MIDPSNIDTKVAFSLSTKKKPRLDPSSTLPAFQHDNDESKKERRERIRAERSEEPLVIPLQESDKMTLLEMRKHKTQDELAAEALTQAAMERFSGNNTTTSGTTNFSANGGFVISSGQNTNLAVAAVDNSIDKDKQHYLKELERLPDEADDDAYDRVPISEFGAALLRGMGWNGGEESSSKAPPPPAMRPHRLGLGATPKILVPNAIPGKMRTADQVKRDEKLLAQQAGFDKQRQERMAQDKQMTLQIKSLVYCQDRRAKVIQLNGVPGLNRVLVQFEHSTSTTSVKKGELSLIPRSDLDKRPFHENDLEVSGTEQLERTLPVPDRNKQVPETVRSKNDVTGSRKRRHEASENENRLKETRRQHDDRRWVIPNIRVRVITKKLGSDYYKEKGIVVDVTHFGGVATLQMPNGRVLDKVPERYIETALPKVGGNAIVLSGKSKFAKGTLLERDSKSGKGVIQVFDDMSILKLSLDDLAEWVGPLDDDMME